MIEKKSHGGARTNAGRPRVRLTKPESAAMLRLAQSYGYDDAGEFYLAIISGEVAIVLMADEEREHAIGKLLTSDDDALANVGRQLQKAADRETNAA